MAPENPLRVLVIVSNLSPSWTQACNSPESLVPLAIQLIKEKTSYDALGDTLPDTRLLAIQRWNVRVLFTFDISNIDYDVDLGHKPEEKQNNLPVVVVHLSKSHIVYEANSGTRERVNKDIAFLHDANGYGAVLPFIEDHTLDSPPEYPNPRSLTHN
jgi:hypothetical protein